METTNLVDHLRRNYIRDQTHKKNIQQRIQHGKFNSTSLLGLAIQRGNQRFLNSLKPVNDHEGRSEPKVQSGLKAYVQRALGLEKPPLKSWEGSRHLIPETTLKGPNNKNQRRSYVTRGNGSNLEPIEYNNATDQETAEYASNPSSRPNTPINHSQYVGIVTNSNRAKFNRGHRVNMMMRSPSNAQTTSNVESRRLSGASIKKGNGQKSMKARLIVPNTTNNGRRNSVSLKNDSVVPIHTVTGQSQGTASRGSNPRSRSPSPSERTRRRAVTNNNLRNFPPKSGGGKRRTRRTRRRRS
jgi:hypothetical protein